MTIVRCYFELHDEWADLRFVRVPTIGETVMHGDAEWRVVKVTWATEGPFLTLSLVA